VSLTRGRGDTVTRGKGINVYRTRRFARVRHMQGRREEETAGVYADIRRGFSPTENAAYLFQRSGVEAKDK
jgi:hypothetical protein